MLVSKVNYSSNVSNPKTNFGSAIPSFAKFSITNPERWGQYIKANRSDTCALEFAARWANLMENAMSKGAKLRDVADSTSQEAAYEGMSGKVGEFATTALTEVWEHGNELKAMRNEGLIP